MGPTVKRNGGAALRPQSADVEAPKGGRETDRWGPVIGGRRRGKGEDGWLTGGPRWP